MLEKDSAATLCLCLETTPTPQCLKGKMWVPSSQKQRLSTYPWIPRGPCLEDALLRKTLSYSNLDFSTNGSPIPMFDQGAGSPQQRPHSILRKYQYPVPQIKLFCPKVEGTWNRASELWHLDSQPQLKQLILVYKGQCKPMLDVHPYGV